MRTVLPVVIALLACGCTSHRISFTSEPSGAAVHLHEDGTWEQKGSTPCSIMVSWFRYAENPPEAALLTFDDGEEVLVDLHLHRRQIMTIPGTVLFIGGSVVSVAGAIGNSIGVVYAGFGSMLVGWRAANDFSYTNRNYHVTQEAKTQSNNASQPIAASAAQAER